MPKEIRSHVLKVRLSDDELATLDSRAGDSTRAAYARAAVLGESNVKTIKRTVADPALVSALGSIGNNINQLARHANQRGDLPSMTELHNIKLELQKLLP